MHVGIITLGYPPLLHVSHKRPRYMGRDLARLGHEVSVVTVDWRSPDPVSIGTPVTAVRNARIEEGVRVIRIDPRSWYPGFCASSTWQSTEGSAPRLVLLRKIQTAFRAIVWGPSPSWGRAALRALLDLHAASPIHVSWAIHGDATSHEVAHRLCAARGVPWVADFKDPWDGISSGLARGSRLLGTRRRLRSASAITETCEAQGRLDASRFGLPVATIYSGYDDALMASAAPVRSSDDFTLCYLGHLSRQHHAEKIPALFSALAEMDPGLARRARLYAYTSDENRALSNCGLGSQLAVHSLLDQEGAFSRMKGADVLLLLPSPSPLHVGVKEIEYLASGSPVLVLGQMLPELARLLPRDGPVCQAGDDQTAARFVSACARGEVARGPVNPGYLADFHWPSQGARLETVLKCARQGLEHHRGSAPFDYFGCTALERESERSA